MDKSFLSATSIEILKELSVNPNCTTRSFPPDYLPIIRQLAKRKLIVCRVKFIGSVAMWPVQITQLGRDVLSESEAAREQMAQNVADQQAQQKRMASERAENRFQFWITTFIALVSLIKSFWPELTALWAWLWK